MASANTGNCRDHILDDIPRAECADEVEEDGITGAYHISKVISWLEHMRCLTHRAVVG